MTLSHEDLLLLILSDGRWHSLHEILRRHPMMVHSRASDLRIKRGYNIEHRCVGKGAIGSEYRWLSLSGRAEPRAGAHTGSPAGDRMTPSECGYRTSARPLSDRPLTPEGDGNDGLHGQFVSPSDVSGGPLTEGGALAPASAMGREPEGETLAYAPPSVSGRIQRSAADDPLNPAPAAQLTAPSCTTTAFHRAPHCLRGEQAARAKRQESMAGQLTLSEEAA